MSQLPLGASTNGLSVYNALDRCGDMSTVAILSFLRKAWDPDMEPGYVDLGVAFLLEKEWVSIDAGQVVLLTRGKKAVRINDDADLELRPK